MKDPHLSREINTEEEEEKEAGHQTIGERDHEVVKTADVVEEAVVVAMVAMTARMVTRDEEITTIGADMTGDDAMAVMTQKMTNTRRIEKAMKRRDKRIERRRYSKELWRRPRDRLKRRREMTAPSMSAGSISMWTRGSFSSSSRMPVLARSEI